MLYPWFRDRGSGSAGPGCLDMGCGRADLGVQITEPLRLLRCFGSSVRVLFLVIKSDRGRR